MDPPLSPAGLPSPSRAPLARGTAGRGPRAGKAAERSVPCRSGVAAILEEEGSAAVVPILTAGNAPGRAGTYQGHTCTLATLQAPTARQNETDERGYVAPGPVLYSPAMAPVARPASSGRGAMHRPVARSAPRAPQSPLVGRDRELALLKEQLAAALAGEGSLVLIGGEAVRKR